MSDPEMQMASSKLRKRVTPAMMEMTANKSEEGGTDHSQLPSLEEARMAAAQEHGTDDQLKRRLQYTYIGLAALGVALLVTIIIAITKGSGSPEIVMDGIVLSPSSMKAAIQEEAYPVLDYDKFSDYDFMPGRAPSFALQRVQARAHSLTYTQTVEAFALWVLYYETNLDSTWKRNPDNDQDWCLFEGIRCDRKGKVVDLVLTDIGMTGFIPEEVLLLKDLRTFNLSNNKDLGDGHQLPTWFMHKSQASDIQVVDFTGTAYAGSVDKRYCDQKPSSMAFSMDCPDKVQCSCCVGCSS